MNFGDLLRASLPLLAIGVGALVTADLVMRVFIRGFRSWNAPRLRRLLMGDARSATTWVSPVESGPLIPACTAPPSSDDLASIARILPARSEQEFEHEPVGATVGLLGIAAILASGGGAIQSHAQPPILTSERTTAARTTRA